MVHPWPGIKVAIAIPGPSMDQAWPGMELPWTIHGHGWNAIESQYGLSRWTKFQDYKKTLYLRYKQPRLNLKAHFTQQRLFLLIFIIKMLKPAEKILHAKMREKLR